MHPLDEWLETIPEDEKDKIALPEVWNAAVDATMNALLEAGNIDNHYRPEWTATAESVKWKSAVELSKSGKE